MKAVIVCLVLLLGCSPLPAAEPSPLILTSGTAPSDASVSASPTASTAGRAATQLLLTGRLTTVPMDADTQGGLAYGGVVYALTLPNAPAPYRSKLVRYDVARTTWRDVFTDDAWFQDVSFDAGRVGLVEYREPFQGGGAFDDRLLLVDLSTNTTTPIDAFGLSSATYRGGGGGPRRPGARMLIHGLHVAWTRLTELAGGVIEGELRLGDIADPTRASTLARSREFVTPLWLDDAVLNYAVAGEAGDVVRSHDLLTGVERTVATLPAPNQRGGRSGLAHSGETFAWIEYAVPSAYTLHTVNIGTGAARDLDLGTNACVGLSGNAFGFVWTCQGRPQQTATLSYFDPRAWKSVDVVRSSDLPNDLRAVEDGFMWYDLVNGARRLNLLTIP